MRTSNLIGFNPSRPMSLAYDSASGDLGGNNGAVLGTKAPGAAGGPDLKDYTKAHGVIGEDCIATLALKVGTTISVWFFNKKWGEWIKGGAGAADYSKVLEDRGQWAFYGQEGTRFYLVAADVGLVDALLHCRPVDQG